MKELSDDILIAASRRGDNTAYAMLVYRYYKEVLGICTGILGNLHDAEDITQEALLKGFMKLSNLRDSERFEHWILRIAKNLCIDFMRKRKHSKAWRGNEPVASAQSAGANSDLEHAIRRLPGELRLPLVMYYFDDKSAKAIAGKLNISYSGVCHRIRLARKQLHELLTQKVYDE